MLIDDLGFMKKSSFQIEADQYAYGLFNRTTSDLISMKVDSEVIQWLKMIIFDYLA